MNEKKLNNPFRNALLFLGVIFLGVMLWLILIQGYKYFNNEWESDYEFTNDGYVAVTKEDFINGRDCSPEECRDIATGEDTRIVECYCALTNKTFRMIATKRILVEKYEWPNYRAEVLKENNEN